MGGRRLYVAMDELLDAIDTSGEGRPRFFLDLASGELALTLAEADVADDDPGYAPLPPAPIDEPAASESAEDASRRRHARLLATALTWLEGLGIEPQYELRPPRAARPGGRPGAEAGGARFGLLDLLLLGAPGAEDDAKAVLRTFVAIDNERARNAFVRVARDVCLHEGLAWHGDLVAERNDYQAGRFDLRLVGRRLRLVVALPRGLRALFGGEEPPADL